MLELFVTIFYLLFIVAPIGTIIHEVGHAIGAKIVKADHIHLSIGLGRKINNITIKNFHIEIHSFFFLGGFVSSHRDPAYQPLELVLIAIFGPLHNLFYGLLFYYLYLYYAHEYIQLLYLFNLWLAIINIIPFRIKKRRSDGYTVFKILSDRC